MAEQRYKSIQNEFEGCTDREAKRFERIIMERKGRAVMPAIAAPIVTASAQPTSTGMFMHSTMPQLKGRESMGTFLKGSEPGRA